MQKFTFGGNTDWTADDIKRKRAIANALMRQIGTPRNVGEGLSAIGKALAVRGINKRADAREQELRNEFDDSFSGVAPNKQGLIDLANSPYASKAHKTVIEALLKGAPNYKRGTLNAKGGMAVVGENGPEVVNLPKHAQVYPVKEMPAFGQALPDGSPLDPADADELYSLPPADRNKAIQRIMNGESPREVLQPEGWDPRMMIPREESSFKPGAEYQTADLSGLKPSGVGEQSQLHGTARTFQGFMKSLQDYEELFKNGGATMWPGARRDELSTAHRDLQMQMKELYNLGVLNGPDLDLMNQILLDPTAAGGNIMDALGIADMEKRVPANIENVRRMMLNRSAPGLQQIGVDPQSLMPKKKDTSDLSDEELLKMLGGG